MGPWEMPLMQNYAWTQCFLHRSRRSFEFRFPQTSCRAPMCTAKLPQGFAQKGGKKFCRMGGGRREAGCSLSCGRTRRGEAGGHQALRKH